MGMRVRTLIRHVWSLTLPLSRGQRVNVKHW